MTIVPVILAGGTGSRLWPLSRELYPKQVINLLGNNSLLQNTMFRLEGLENLSDPLVVVGEEHRFMAKRQVEEVNGFSSSKFLLEPKGNNTAPAICGSAIYAAQNGLEDGILLVLPADHLVKDVDVFHSCVTEAVEVAKDGKLVTFGIPHTALKPVMVTLKKVWVMICRVLLKNQI